MLIPDKLNTILGNTTHLKGFKVKKFLCVSNCPEMIRFHINQYISYETFSKRSASEFIFKYASGLALELLITYDAAYIPNVEKDIIEKIIATRLYRKLAREELKL